MPTVENMHIWDRRISNSQLTAMNAYFAIAQSQGHSAVKWWNPLI